MDGKHIRIKQPSNSGSYYHNYKNWFSIILLAVVDANYQFILVDVGCNGRISDGGVYQNSTISLDFEENTLNIPKPRSLTENSVPIPFMIVADDAFPLKKYIQKPYSQISLTTEKRIFNYRLSRARRIVENAFGIMANRFRVFMSPIGIGPEKVEQIVLASCYLHNFLRSQAKTRPIYTPPGSFDIEDPDTHQVIPGEWRHQQQSQGMQPLKQQGSNRHSDEAKMIRDHLKESLTQKVEQFRGNTI